MILLTKIRNITPVLNLLDNFYYSVVSGHPGAKLWGDVVPNRIVSEGSGKTNLFFYT